MGNASAMSTARSASEISGITPSSSKVVRTKLDSGAQEQPWCGESRRAACSRVEAWSVTQSIGRPRRDDRYASPMATETAQGDAPEQPTKPASTGSAFDDPAYRV